LRIGTGWDRHRYEKGRRCVLGAVEFPDCPVGPLGHSDGDALVHAVIDAVLGAAALGDIGSHFPDTDPAWTDADSLDLLRRTVAAIESAGWSVGNIDATVIAELPHLSTRIDEIRERLAAALKIAVGAVSVKATRGEGLGPEGRGECVTAMAVALLIPAD